MTENSTPQPAGAPRWRYLFLAVLITALVALLMILLWQVPHAVPQVATPTASAVPTAPPAPVMNPIFTTLTARADDQARRITFQTAASVPEGRQIAEMILWYDTESGRQLQRTEGPLGSNIAISYQLDAVQEGLTATHSIRELDYWWWLLDTSGESVRAGGSVPLGPALQTLATTSTIESPTPGFTWTVSETDNLRFHFKPGSASQRDRFQIGTLAENALALVAATLQTEFDDQMNIYLVPRVFWQGGATYAGKHQLISYLDRNYTAVEIWSYFTHEGTHALAQDLRSQSQTDGGPDGVLVEGLAVWASGGHYRLDPIDEWAASTAASDTYIPLAELRAGPFYDFQHEISYLEAGSFVKFLIDRFGLDRFKELYGNVSGESARDEQAVQRLYGLGYAELEAEWLDYLGDLLPSPEQTEEWQLEIRSFDLMRRYETELDPDARTLPTTAPPEWTSDTFKIFEQPAAEPVNVVLETALIAVQTLARAGDLDGAQRLLDDIELSLDSGGELSSSELEARRAIVGLLAIQDRAIVTANEDIYQGTLEPTYATSTEARRYLSLPFTLHRQDLVRLTMADDLQSADGAVAIDARLADGELSSNQLFALSLVKSGNGWLVSDREAIDPPRLVMPPTSGR